MEQNAFYFFSRNQEEKKICCRQDFYCDELADKHAEEHWADSNRRKKCYYYRMALKSMALPVLGDIESLAQEYEQKIRERRVKLAEFMEFWTRISYGRPPIPNLVYRANG